MKSAVCRFVTCITLFFALASFEMQGQNVMLNPNTASPASCMPDYTGVPWVIRTSYPYTIGRGLAGRHLSVWASHGRYYDNSRDEWRWQRPFLFCTTEDLLSQSFVYPYLIPMLERAGAIVFTPRERDCQPLEAIVDGDTPSVYGTYDESGTWQHAGTGFGLTYATLNDTVQPFRSGTSRCAVADGKSSALWMPQIPATGDYAVYVSYPSLPTSTDHALYTVRHSGRTTTFSVNQQIGGGTWVYLGTFRFDEGQSSDNSVTLSSDGQHPSQLISADAVRFGGGRSRTERSNPIVTATYRHRVMQHLVDSVLCDTAVIDTLFHYTYGKGVRSGLPCYLEAARYYTQWAGLADSLYTSFHGLDDYKDDLRSRSYLINRLAGGSCYQPDTIGQRVPLELQFALHTDAGYHRSNNIYGSLVISTPYDDAGHDCYRSGLQRPFSETFADYMLHDVASDLSRLYGVSWPQRENRVANYSETRSPQVPAIILELLSHQNFRDMRYAHDPEFRFHASRAIYKSLLRTVYRIHGLGTPVIQPLPVSHMAACIVDGESPMAQISWQAQTDSLEPSAAPTDYVLYVRQHGSDWDEGTLTRGLTTAMLSLQPGTHYEVRVTALNDGGESFPSQPVSVYVPRRSADTPRRILVVDAFDRLSGPAFVESPDSIGFDLQRDAGVAYGFNSSICGAQTIFSPSAVGRSTRYLGLSGTEYTGLLLAGNRHDGLRLHTDDLISILGDRCQVATMSRAAFDDLSDEDLRGYDLIDFAAGLQADLPQNLRHYEIFGDRTRKLLSSYERGGGRLFVSGSYLGQADSLFLDQTLHATYRAALLHNARGHLYGFGMSIPFYNAPGPAHYPCQESHVLEPSGGSTFCAIVYGNGSDDAFSAAVAWPHGVTLAFPYDCISDDGIRQQLMRAVLEHLGLKEQ